jgi:DNA-binding response OmpR family regulator
MRSEVNRPRLLLVEDDRATSAALKGILTLRGWDVTVAMTLAQAKSEINGNADLGAVVLDLMLPDGAGEELLETLRARGVPVAVTTGVDDLERIARVEELEPTAILRKPIVLSQLIKAISSAA